MFNVLVHHIESGRERTLSAEQYANQIVNKGRAGNYELFSADGERNPVHFRPATRRQEGGTKAPRRACFAHMPGQAPNVHVFDRAPKMGFNEAVGSGQLVLLNLNDDLSYRDIDCSSAAEHTVDGGMSYATWRANNAGNYQTVSVGSVREAIKTIRQVKALAGGGSEFEGRVFANYGGGVIPYSGFVIPASAYMNVPKENRGDSTLVKLFNGLRGEAGVRLENGKARAIGMPRLIQFLPTKAMREAGDKARHIRGTALPSFDAAESHIFSQLIFSGDENVSRPEAYTDLKDAVLTNPHGVFVLASPTITIHPPEEEVEHPGKMLRWVINDIEAQTVPAGEVRAAMSHGPAASTP